MPSALSVPMVYSSDTGEGLLYSYARSFCGSGSADSGGSSGAGSAAPAAPACALGIGSTGSPQSQAGSGVLDWAQLRHDLLAARTFTREIYVYSLEGTALSGMLGQVAAMDWSAPPPRPPLIAIAATDELRAQGRGYLEKSCVEKPATCTNHTSSRTFVVA